jgi:transcriptional regulator with PAS, ATPase and Fis domain
VVDDGFCKIIGNSTPLRHTVQKARRLAQVDAALLLYGETGVGKELFARAVHDSGPHAEGPFVALNCGGLPRELLASELFGYVDGAFTGARRTGMIGKIEAAHGGTLFLDELAEMPLDLQPYLLRVLEGGEVYPLGCNKPRAVSFRLIAACNRDLQSEISAARFRMDLFYRISVTSLRLPPLRERHEDLRLLVDHFARLVAERHQLPIKRFTQDVVAAFAGYPWPGNLRELRNVVESMALLSEGEEVGVSAIPSDLNTRRAPTSDVPPRPAAGQLKEVERETISRALRLYHGNLTSAARQLRIARSTLYIKVKKYALDSLLSSVRGGEMETEDARFTAFEPEAPRV